MAAKVWARVAALLVVLIVVACGGGGVPPYVGDPPGFADCAPVGDIDKPVLPKVTCVIEEGSLRTVVFGYQNLDSKTVTIPSGYGNQYAPALDGRAATGAIRPPSSFFSGEHAAAFAVSYLSFLGDLSWSLTYQGVTNTASSSGAPTCEKFTLAGETRLRAPAGGESIAIARYLDDAIDQTILPTAAPSGNAIGSTIGNLSISPDGGSSYTIPIWTSPGRVGMQPELALSYGSGGGNGPIGVGWALVGLSQIARCPRTLETSLAAAPIKFDDSDQLCLDGDPLVGDPQKLLSPLHDPGTRVRIERDTMGPARFIVELANGRILRYGDGGSTLQGLKTRYGSEGFEDAQERKQVRLAWMLAEVADRRGNSMRYTYEDADLHDVPGCTSSGPAPCDLYEKRLTAISYTHRPGGSGATKRVEFHYEERPDSDVTFVGGLALKKSGRLTSVEAYGPTVTQSQSGLSTSLLRRYTLEYTSSGLSGRSLLTSIRECDGAGVCRNPTQFNYEEGSTEYLETPSLGKMGQAGTPTGDFHVADFDGDGLDDLLYQRGGSWYLRVHASDVTFGAEFSLTTLPERSVGGFVPPPAMPIDLDHDGKIDLIYPQFVATPPSKEGLVYHQLYYRAFTWNGSSFEPLAGYDETPPAVLPLGDKIEYRYYVDLDGDDRPEMVTRAEGIPGNWNAKSSTVGGISVSDAPPPTLAPPLAAPVDGSRLWSLLLASGDRYEVARIDGYRSRSPIPVGGHSVVLGDVNADGAADAFVRRFGTVRSTAFNATGDGFRAVDLPSVIDAGGYPLVWQTSDFGVHVDYFEDGKGAWLTSHLTGSGAQNHLLRLNGLAGPTWTPFPLSFLIGGPYARVADLNGDGLQDIIAPVGGELRAFVRGGKRADLLTSVTSGLGDQTGLSYLPARLSASKPPSSVCGYPVDCGTRGLWVVDRVVRHAQAPDLQRTNIYSFVRPASNASTGAFLGFELTVDLDLDTGSLRLARFSRRAEEWIDPTDPLKRPHHPFAQVASEIETVTNVGGGREIRTTTTNEHAIAPRPENSLAFRVATRSEHTLTVERTGISSAVDTSGPRPAPKFVVPLTTTPLRERFSSFDYDAYGNVTVFKKSEANEVTTVTLEWSPDPASWLLQIPNSRTEVSEVTDPLLSTTKVTRVVSFDVDPTGLVKRVSLEPTSSSAAVRLTRDYVRDGAGNVITTIESAPGAPIRRTDVAFDEIDGTFPTRTLDALGYSSWSVFHPGLGVLAETTDANGVRRKLRYDGFGRIREVVAPRCTSGFVPADGCSGATTKFIDGPSAVAGAAYSIAAVRLGSPSRTDHFDSLGRKIREDAERLDGGVATTTTNWDRRFEDRAASMSELVDPAAGTVRTVSYGFDPLGRPTEIRYPTGGIVRFSYAGRRSTRVDAGGQKTSVEYDLGGKPSLSIEFGGLDFVAGAFIQHESVTSYRYGPFGQLARVRDPEGNLSFFGYDVRGRQVYHRDGDTGLTTSEWNGLGDLVAETDARGRRRELVYDPLGRPLGERSSDGLSCLRYDGAPGGIGALTSSSRLDQLPTGTSRLEQWSEFDALGRTVATHQTIDGGADFSYGMNFDEFGRLARLTYPEVDGAGLSVDYQYKHGHIAGASAGLESARKLRWSVDAVDSTGRVTLEKRAYIGLEKLGPIETAKTLSEVAVNYGYDSSTGQLTRQLAANQKGAVVQDLTYLWYPDGMLRQRLHGNGAALLTENFKYDSNRRLASWSGPWGSVSYEYDELGSLTRRTTKGKPPERFETGGGGGPSGFSGKFDSPPVHAVTKGPLGDYSYDAVGDQVGAPGRTTQFTSFHLPRSIQFSDTDTRADFTYDVARQRVRKAANDQITTYVGGLFELRNSGTEKVAVFTIAAGGALVGQVVRTSGSVSGSSTKVYFLLRDHLGSTSSIVDETGNRIDLQLREPFGRRVLFDKPTELLGKGTSGPVRIGFTGHEEDDELALVNMRGRIYDPRTARFVSPDPVLGAGGQDLNRYAYVRNNPVNLVDPSGFECEPEKGCSGGLGEMPPPTGGPPTTSEPGSEGPKPPASPPPISSPPPPAAPKPSDWKPFNPMNTGAGPVGIYRPGGFSGLSTIGGAYKMAGITLCSPIIGCAMNPAFMGPDPLARSMADRDWEKNTLQAKLAYEARLDPTMPAGLINAGMIASALWSGFGLARGIFVVGRALLAGEAALGSSWFAAPMVAARPAVVGGLRSWVNTGIGTVAKENCAFCTAGGMSGARMTSTEVAAMTEFTEGGLSIRETGQMWTRMGLGDGTMHRFSGFGDAARFMRAQGAGARFGVLYDTGPGMVHAVGARNGTFGLLFQDFQATGLPWFRPTGATPGAKFWVFPF